MSSKPRLNRSLSLFQMVLYGLGTTIGAGIYALVAELAGIAGYFAPVSFLIAAIIASLTALSFAELSSRFPQAAGTAIYVRHGFRSIGFSTLTGVLVSLAGIVSAAALLNAFVAYLGVFTNWSDTILLLLIMLLLGSVLIRGIQTSVNFAGFFTLIEVGGLVLIIVTGYPTLASLPERWSELIPTRELTQWHGIFAASLLAFYAFIGFEDMVVVAEEVKSARVNLPKAIILTLLITTLLYLLVMTAAVLAVPPQQLQHSDAPLSFLFTHFTGQSPVIVNIIALLALINGVLIQMVMASRLLYGLARQRQLPVQLAYVSPRFRTPLISSILVISLVLMLALFGELATLAQFTSMVMLLVFTLVNLALWRIKLRETAPAEQVRVFPLWIPVSGFFISLFFVFVAVLELL